MNIILILRLILVVILFCIVIFILREIVANNKVKRIGFYSLEPLKNDEFSVSDIIIKKYFSFIRNMRNIVSKSVFLTKSSKKYEKYKDSLDQFDQFILVCDARLTSSLSCVSDAHQVLEFARLTNPNMHNFNVHFLYSGKDTKGTLLYKSCL